VARKRPCAVAWRLRGSVCGPLSIVAARRWNGVAHVRGPRFPDSDLARLDFGLPLAVAPAANHSNGGCRPSGRRCDHRHAPSRGVCGICGLRGRVPRSRGGRASTLRAPLPGVRLTPWPVAPERRLTAPLDPVARRSGRTSRNGPDAATGGAERVPCRHQLRVGRPAARRRPVLRGATSTSFATPAVSSPRYSRHTLAAPRRCRSPRAIRRASNQG
jgi:hypothetical protein